MSQPIDTTDGVVVRKRVYLEDLDGFGMLHHARYAVMFDNAVIDFWHDAGWRADRSEQVLAIRELSLTYHLPVMGICDIDIHLWVEAAGRTSVTYRFEVLSPDHMTRYAEGTRVIVNIDPRTMRPAPLTDAMWETAEPLLKRGFTRPMTEVA